MLVKIGAKAVNHGRHATFQSAEAAEPCGLFQEILRLNALCAATAEPRGFPALKPSYAPAQATAYAAPGADLRIRLPLMTQAV